MYFTYTCTCPWVHAYMYNSVHVHVHTTPITGNNTHGRVELCALCSIVYTHVQYVGKFRVQALLNACDTNIQCKLLHEGRA